MSSWNRHNALAVIFLAGIFAGYVAFEDEITAFIGTDAEPCAWAEAKVAETRSPLWEGYRNSTCQP